MNGGQSMEYMPFASLAEESNSGWVWLWETEQLKSRMIVKIVHDGRKVFCECRAIDDNFLSQYNRDGRKPIPEANRDALVINKWFRDALGGVKTQEVVELAITPAKLPGWRAFRAAAHHPDPMVRIATRLGALSVWLGLCSLIAALIPMGEALCRPSVCLVLLAFAIGTGLIGLVALRPVSRARI
jgi:hypothetical protein